MGQNGAYSLFRTSGRERSGDSVYFFGSFDHAVDDRGRVAVPARYRHAFAGGGVLRASGDGCVELYTQEGFEEEVRSRLGAHVSTRDIGGRRVRRGFLPGAFTVELDGQGRVLLPAGMREAAAMESRAVVIGCGDYVELWSPERWEREQAAAALADARGEPGS